MILYTGYFLYLYHSFSQKNGKLTFKFYFTNNFAVLVDK